MRRDLQSLRAGDEISTGLRIVTARRADKSADRVRAVNRLQAQLLEYFPALERALDYSRSKAALLLLTNTAPRTKSAAPTRPGCMPG
ncbi:FMN phosphatase YigB (HAD superfamily) [Arthrobacter sp. MP_M7]|nr:FMN phosphatase YigB (HAD superfamily) [Arthrobacter sp. MP_M4]MEC5204954.1 FMN phosphatase YigB (HAD superfamily) [Arthrobacter sp. MP_M7]